MPIQQYDPRTYGIRGDGTTDCTRSIQLLLNEISDDGGGTLELTEPGTYLISNTTARSGEFADNTAINSALVIYSNTKFLLGKGVTLRLFRGSNCSMLRNYGALVSTATPDTGIEIEGGVWDYQGSAVFAEDFTSNAAGTTLTKTGAFASYTFRRGDTFRYRLLDNSGFGQVSVVEKLSDNAIAVGQLPASLRGIATVYGTVNQQEQVIVSDATTANIGNGIFLKNFRQCSVKNIEVRNTLKFGVYACTFSESHFKNIDGYNPSGGADIFHVNGPAANFTVKNIRGFSNDNMVGLVMGEGTYGNGFAFTDISGVAWTAATRTLTKTGAFTSGRFNAGETITILSGTGWTPGTFTIASRISADQITLSAAGGQPVGDQTDGVISQRCTYNKANKTLAIASSIFPTSLIPGAKLRLISGTDVTVGERQSATYVSGAGTNTITLSAVLRKSGNTADLADGGTDIQGYVEGIYSYLGDEGDIKDCVVDGIHARSDTKSFEPFRITGPLGTTASGVRVSNITGDISAGSAVSFIDDVNGSLSGWVGRGISIENISARLVKQNSAFSELSTPTISITATGLKDLTLRNLTIANSNDDTAIAQWGITIASGVAMETLFIDGVTTITPFASSNAVHFLSLSGTVNNTFINNAHIRAGRNGRFVNFPTGFSGSVAINNSRWEGTATKDGYAFNWSGSGTSRLLLDNCIIENGGTSGYGFFLATSCSATITLSINNTEFRNMYRVLDVGGATTASVTIRGAGVTFTSINNAVVGIAGGAGTYTLLTSFNPDWQMLGERTSGTQPKGAVFNNTSTAGSGGSPPATNWGTLAVGPVIFNGTAWERWGRTA